MREADRIMTDDLGIDLPLMMESAGRHLAYLGRLRYLDGDATDRHAVVLAGPGANLCAAPTIALDVPSGVDASTGVAHDPSIRAAVTLTLAIPKVGLRLPSVAAAVGELYLADIGIPPHVLARAGIDNAQSLFASEEIVRIW